MAELMIEVPTGSAAMSEVKPRLDEALAARFRRHAAAAMGGRRAPRDGPTGTITLEAGKLIGRATSRRRPA